MSRVTIDERTLEDIADAIRAKSGQSGTYRPGDMAGAIEDIPTGITPTGSVSITQNGTTDVTNYASAAVNVPNSYGAGDEGKVVKNGALASQSTRTVNANGTYDTTENNSTVVNVPNSYSASDEGKVVSNGALAAQSSQTVTENGTYDTTLKNEVVVNVSGGGGGGSCTPVQLTFEQNVVADSNNFVAVYDGFRISIMGRLNFTGALSQNAVIATIPSEYKVLSTNYCFAGKGTTYKSILIKVLQDGTIRTTDSISSNSYIYLSMEIFATDQQPGTFTLAQNITDAGGCKYMIKNGLLIGQLSIVKSGSAGWRKVFTFPSTDIPASLSLSANRGTSGNQFYNADTFVDTNDMSGNVYFENNAEHNIIVIGVMP